MPFNLNDPFGVHRGGRYDPGGLHGPGGIFATTPTMPETPDPNAVAQQQLAYGAQAQGLNAPNQQGIFAGTDYQRDPTTGAITGVKTSLTPEMQAIYDSLRAGVGTRPGETSDAVYSQYTSRLDPQFQQREADLDNRLANMGLTPGSEAYNREKDILGRERTDAYGAARRDATLAGGQEQSRLLSNIFGFAPAANAGYQAIPQVATPNYGDYAYGTYKADKDKFSALTANRSNQLGGVIKAIGSFSDRRLKSNIVRVGTHKALGVGVYSYTIFGEPSVGVMADEVERVMPDAVLTHPSGFKMVRYEMLNG